MKLREFVKALWWCSPFALPILLAEQQAAFTTQLCELLLKDIQAQRLHREQSQLWRDRMVG